MTDRQPPHSDSPHSPHPPPSDRLTPTMPEPRAVVCPYCGGVTVDRERCGGCGGRFDPLSRQATQNGMGPWFVLDPRQPTRPGCSYTVLKGMVRRGAIGLEAVIRGPTTRQFWMLARHTPGVAHLLGVCHSCGQPARGEEFSCVACGAGFEVDQDRQHLGLGAVRGLPGEGAERVAPVHGGVLGAGRVQSEPTPLPFGSAVAPNAVVPGAAVPGALAEHRAARRAKDRARRRAMVWAGVGVIGAVAIGFGIVRTIGLMGAAGAAPQPAPEPGGAAVTPVLDENETPIGNDGTIEPAGEREDASEKNDDAVAVETPLSPELALLLERARAALGSDEPGQIGDVLDEIERVEGVGGVLPEALVELRTALVERRALLRLRALP